jgi:hypothetical protein
LLNLASQVVSIVEETQKTQKTQKTRKTRKTQKTQKLSIVDNSSKPFTWLDDIDEEKAAVHEVHATFDDKSEVSLRGFNKAEQTHVWMSELAGEVDLSSLVEASTYAREINVTCAPFMKGIEPSELSLFIDTYLVEKKLISHDFMQYSFNLSKEQFIRLYKNDFIIELQINHNGIENNGERMLSLCVSRLALLLQK